MKIITYNTHLFTGTVPAAFVDLEYEDDIRKKEILGKLEGEAPDIVCLQEVWGNSSRQWFIDNCGAPFFSHYRPDDAGKALSSGLLIMADHLIQDVGFIPFKDGSGWDAQAAKGIAMATIRTNDGKVMAHVVTIHTQSGESNDDVQSRKLQFGQVCEVIRNMEQTHGWKNEPIILCGDFNVIGEAPGGAYPTTEYITIDNMLNGVGLIDAFRQVHPTTDTPSNPGYTINTFTNKLAAHFNSSGQAETMRLDYFYVNRSVAIRNCDVGNYGWVYSNKSGLMDDSDHYPLIMEYETA